jgi:hypothetical protein
LRCTAGRVLPGCDGMAGYVMVWGALSLWCSAVWVWQWGMAQYPVAVLFTTVSGAAERGRGGVGGLAL